MRLCFEEGGKSMTNIARKAFRVTEVCKMFGVSQSLIYKMIDRGELPDVRFAGCRIIPADAVDAVFQHNPGPSTVGQAARDAVTAKSRPSATA